MAKLLDEKFNIGPLTIEFETNYTCIQCEECKASADVAGLTAGEWLLSHYKASQHRKYHQWNGIDINVVKEDFGPWEAGHS